MKFLLCVLLASASVSFAAVEKINSVSIMTYNLENLFDTKHDEGKKDWTYLPLAFKQSSPEVQAYCNSLSNEYYKKSCLEKDWNKAKLATKMKNLAQVIKQYGHGHGADIVVFQEVENIAVLTEFTNKYLRKYGYRYITLAEGLDSRGIDVAMIARVPVLAVDYHHVNLVPYSTRETRYILEVTFSVNGKTVTVFGNHWPSQGNVDETRLVASEVLRDAALRSISDLVVAAGDFNTVDNDLINGIEINILPHFEDIEVKGRRYSQVSAKGTHWYKGHWSSLDKIFVLKRSLQKSQVRVNYSSFEIIQKSFMTHSVTWTDEDTNTTQTSHDVPLRFDGESGKGYSDHLPVAVEFDL